MRLTRYHVTQHTFTNHSTGPRRSVSIKVSYQNILMSVKYYRLLKFLTIYILINLLTVRVIDQIPSYYPGMTMDSQISG